LGELGEFGASKRRIDSSPIDFVSSVRVTYGAQMAGAGRQNATPSRQLDPCCKQA
jgi:hypothetical protein